MDSAAGVREWIRTTSIVLAGLMFAGCAGGPVETEKPPAGPDPALMENARQLIEKGAPEHLREALELLRAPAERFAEAEQQAAFARSLFELLYPELADSGYLPAPRPVEAYSGPYAGDLERARSGRAPAAGPEAAAGDFFDLVVPALFLSRAGTPANAGQIPDLTPYYRLLERAEARNRASVLPPYLQGRIDELEGRLEQAASRYEDSVERAATFYPGRQRLAALLLRAGQAGQAVALLEQNAELLPQALSIRYDLAEAYYRSGREEAAAEEAARILIQRPDHPQAMLLRSRILAAEGNWIQALRLLNLLLYQHPENEEAYQLAARLQYEKAKDPEVALELLEQAEQRFPNEALFPETAGRIYLETGRSAEGLNKLQRALDLEPGRVSTLRLLLTNAVNMRRWLQSATYLSEILEQEQSEADLLQAIEIYGNLGDRDQALHFAEQLYAAGPSVKNLTIYARALIEAGQTGTAAPLVEQGLERAESPALHSTLLALKASLLAEESPEEALALLREALLEHPENFDALLRIAELYEEQRELRKASLYLKQALALQPHNSSVRVRLRNVEEELGVLDAP